MLRIIRCWHVSLILSLLFLLTGISQSRAAQASLTPWSFDAMWMGRFDMYQSVTNWNYNANGTVAGTWQTEAKEQILQSSPASSIYYYRYLFDGIATTHNYEPFSSFWDDGKYTRFYASFGPYGPLQAQSNKVFIKIYYKKYTAASNDPCCGYQYMYDIYVFRYNVRQVFASGPSATVQSFESGEMGFFQGQTREITPVIPFDYVLDSVEIAEHH
jgi:hypothetical protein